MTPTREHLLGYLLGALERTECEQVERELSQNPALREELRRLKGHVGRLGLTDEPDDFDPPAGLAARTCQCVAFEVESRVQVSRTALSPVASAEYHAPRRFSWADLLAAAAVLVAGFSVFLPALAHSQFQAEIAVCQNHLRQLGLALHEYATLDEQRRFPRIEPATNRSVAGIYAPILVGQQLVLDPRTFVCPSSQLAQNINRLQIPAMDELDRASGATLASYHQNMGGDYGYAMGYTENGDLMPLRDSRRSNYVLLADKPSDERPGRTTAHHAGRGQNLMCEDGHVTWCRSIPSVDLADDPFHNRQGEVAAGVDSDDAVVGAGADRPVPVRLISN